MMLPFTGPAASYGPLLLAGIQVAFDEANDAGGVLGRNLSISHGPALWRPLIETKLCNHLPPPFSSSLFLFRQNVTCKTHFSHFPHLQFPCFFQSQNILHFSTKLFDAEFTQTLPNLFSCTMKHPPKQHLFSHEWNSSRILETECGWEKGIKKCVVWLKCVVFLTPTPPLYICKPP